MRTIEQIKQFLLWQVLGGHIDTVGNASVSQGNIDPLTNIPPDPEDRESLERIKSFDAEEFARKRQRVERQRYLAQQQDHWPVDMNSPSPPIQYVNQSGPRPDMKRVAAIAQAIGGQVLTDKDYEHTPIEKKL